MSKFFYEDSNSINRWSVDFEYDDQSVSTNLDKGCEKNDIMLAIKKGLVVTNGYTINVTVNDKKYMLNPEKWIEQLFAYLEKDTVDNIVNGLCESIRNHLNNTKPSLTFTKNDSLFKVFTILNFEKDDICKASFTVERVIENELIHNFKKTDTFVWYSTCNKSLYDFLGYKLIVNYNFSLQETKLLLDQFESNLKGVVRLNVPTDLLDDLQFTFPTGLFELFCDNKEKSAEDFLKYYKGILMKVVCKDGEEYEVNNAYYDLEKFFHEILSINHNTHWKTVCQVLETYRIRK